MITDFSSCGLVAVETAIADRPPHGSRRALLTYRALPSGSGVHPWATAARRRTLAEDGDRIGAKAAFEQGMALGNGRAALNLGLLLEEDGDLSISDFITFIEFADA